MGWLTQTISSSLGKKYIMALTGFFLLLYLAIHLFGNTFLYVGKDAFNLYVETLTESKLKPLIRVIEVVLLAGFLIHIYDGIVLTLGNWKARPQRYAVRPSDPQSSMSSRNMWLTASIVFFFLVIHVQQFWYVYHYDRSTYTMYDLVVNAFTNPVYAVIYLISVLFLGFHLYHGFQSAFQSLGWNHKKYTPLVIILGKIYSIIIAVGFASFPIYFLMRGRI